MARVQQVAGPQQHLVTVKGLDQKVVGTQQQGRVAHGVSIVRGHHDHRQEPTPLAVRGPFLQQLEAIGRRHVEVEQDKVRLKLAERSGRLGRFRHSQDVVGQVHEHRFHEGDVHRLVIHDHDSVRHSAPVWSARVTRVCQLPFNVGGAPAPPPESIALGWLEDRLHQTGVSSVQAKSNLARVNGIELGYQVFGEGEPLILLHGGFGSLEMFGANIGLLAAGRQVIGVDLQSHGRSPAADRPMTFEAMGDDIGALIRELGFQRAAIMGFSLGGGVALRTAIQHPDVMERLVLVSTVFTNHGWHPEMTAGMKAMGPETAEPIKQNPMYESYKQVAPNVDDWPVLVKQLTDLLKLDYDWSADIPRLAMPVMLVIGDADGLPPSHAVNSSSCSAAD